MDRLHAKRLIKRDCDRDDRRRVSIVATAAGKALVAKPPFSLHFSLERTLKQMAEKERRLVVDNMDRLVELMTALNTLAPLQPTDRDFAATVPYRTDEFRKDTCKCVLCRNPLQSKPRTADVRSLYAALRNYLTISCNTSGSRERTRQRAGFHRFLRVNTDTGPPRYCRNQEYWMEMP